MCFRGSPGSTRTTIETASRQKFRVESAVSAPAFRMPLMCSDMSADWLFTPRPLLRASPARAEAPLSPASVRTAKRRPFFRTGAVF